MEATLRAYIEKRMAEIKTPGVGVGIIKDGEVIFAGGFGTRDTNTGEPIDSQTAYLIGSSTKGFTTTSIAMLAEDGLVEWDKPVRNYLPSFGFNDEYVSEHVTLTDLGSHRTGVADEVEWMGSKLSRGALVASIRKFNLNEGFRAKFQYNSSMYMTLGHIVSNVANSEFEDVVRNRILKPLGMTKTVWSDLSGDNPPFQKNVAFPHAVEDGLIKRIDFEFEGAAIRPSGTLTSNIDDMLKWVQFNLNEGKYGGKELLSEEGFKELITPHMLGGDHLNENGWPQMYGLGWFLETYFGHRVVHHGGSSTGTIGQVLFMPDDNFGVVVFTNTEHDFPEELARYIVGLFVGGEGAP